MERVTFENIFIVQTNNRYSSPVVILPSTSYTKLFNLQAYMLHTDFFSSAYKLLTDFFVCMQVTHWLFCLHASYSLIILSAYKLLTDYLSAYKLLTDYFVCMQVTHWLFCLHTYSVQLPLTVCSLQCLREACKSCSLEINEINAL